MSSEHGSRSLIAAAIALSATTPEDPYQRYTLYAIINILRATLANYGELLMEHRAL